MTISYSLAETKHGTEVIAQLPRLAAFDHPSRLRAEDFWRDDAKIVRRWQSGAARRDADGTPWPERTSSCPKRTPGCGGVWNRQRWSWRFKKIRF